jgi:hypothetical protein
MEGGRISGLRACAELMGVLGRWFIHENGLGVKELVMSTSSLPVTPGRRRSDALVELVSPRAVHQSSIRARGA